MSLRDKMDHLWAAIDDQDFDVFDRMVDPNCEYRSAAGDLLGADMLKKQLFSTTGAYTNLSHRIFNAVEHGDELAFELEWSGVHSAPLQLPLSRIGEIPATGKTVEYTLAFFCQFKDDELVRIRSYVDPTSPFRQIGLSAESTYRLLGHDPAGLVID